MCARRVHWDVDPELRPRSGHTVKSDLAPHETRETPGDDESDSGPLDRSGLLSCSLKGLKELVLLVRWNAHAGVANGDAKMRRARLRHRKRHLSGRAVVLDRVRSEVHEDLRDSRPI